MTPLARKLLTLCGLALSALLLLTVVVHAQGTAALAGRVANGTAGGTVPAGQQVSLRIMYGDGRIEDRQAGADEGGRFEFRDVPSDGITTYVLFTEYKGVTYGFQVASLSAAIPELTIYETEGQGSKVTLDSNVMIIGWADGGRRVLGVLENARLLNSDDRTFVSDVTKAGEMNFLRFSLPPSYSSLDVQSTLGGGEVVPVDRGFALTTPIPPGLHELLFTYLISYEGDGLSFVRSFPFGTNSFMLLMPENLAALKVPSLKDIGPATIGNTKFMRLEGSGFGRDATVEVELRGLPQPSLIQRLRNALRGGTIFVVVVPVLLALALGGLLGYVLLRRRASRRESAGQEVLAGGQGQALIASIARLDDLFERGEIGQDEYERQRADLKARLLQQAAEDSDREE